MWLNTDTKQIVTRASPTKMMNDYGGNWDTPFSEPPPPWVYKPDLTQVVGVDKEYWKVTYVPAVAKVTDTGTLYLAPASATVEVMTQVERAAVDAAKLSALRESAAAQLDQTENILRAFMLLVLDEINELRADHGRPDYTPVQLRNAIKNKLGS